MPKPNDGETEGDYMARCVPKVLEDGKAENRKQAVAICYSMWEDRDKETDMDAEETLDLGVWTGAYVSSLPSSAFLFVEEGDKGKRHFPYRDASGKVDLAHLRNAIARIPQSNAPGLTPEKKRALQERARKLLAEQSKSLIDRISNLLKSLLGRTVEEDFQGEEIAPEETDGDAATLTEESKEGAEVEQPQIVRDEDASHFFVWKAGESWRWLAVFTNKYRDRDNPPEILTDAAHRDFEKAIDSGEWPMPELWPWHVPHRIGVSDRVAYDDRGFMLATGVFDDKQYAEYLSTRKNLGVSHGMPTKEIRRDKDDSTLIIRYRSREISVLPIDNAANPFTGFLTMEGSNMGLSKDKEEFLRGVVGEERWPSVEAMLADKSKEVEGVEYKAGDELPTATLTLSMPENTTVTYTAVPVTLAPEPEGGIGKADPEVKAVPAVPGISREEVADEIAHLTNAFLEQTKRLVDEIVALKTTVKSMQDVEAERQKENDSLTPAASLHEQVRSRVIGAKSTRVKENDPLLTSGPKVSEQATDGPTPVPLINRLMGGQ